MSNGKSRESRTKRHELGGLGSSSKKKMSEEKKMRGSTEAGGHRKMKDEAQKDLFRAAVRPRPSEVKSRKRKGGGGQSSFPAAAHSKGAVGNPYKNVFRAIISAIFAPCSCQRSNQKSEACVELLTSPFVGDS